VLRFALAIAFVACSPHDDTSTLPPHDPEPAPKLQGPQPRVFLTSPTGDIAVNVEVVSTPAKIGQGLMYRQHLPPDAGMLFLMGYENDWQFYMRNTLIPLDIIFIKKDMKIAGIVENAEPRTETLRQVGVPSLYVLEVNGGWTAAHKIASGAIVRFDNVR
jgi:uncharacterized membrane protein (UPF0127 family)